MKKRITNKIRNHTAGSSGVRGFVGLLNLKSKKSLNLKSSILSLCALSITGFMFLTNTLYSPEVAHAAPNYEINYQGKLTNASNVAVADGTYNMRFWLLTTDSIATTSAVWAEELTGTDKVQVTNGLFSVMLGSTTALTSVDFDQTLYLGVEVGGTGAAAWDGEMSPRKVLGAVPAAFYAATSTVSDTLDNLDSTQFLRSDQDDSASGLLTFTGGLISNSSSSTITNLTSLIATTTTAYISTLNTVSAIDATTEATIEAAIDTLANLTSASSLATVGTITSGTWGGSFSNDVVTPDSVLAAGQVDEYCLTYETGDAWGWDPCNNTSANWQVANGALTPTTTIGIRINASSTIGDGTATGGLTVSGNSTTTGDAYFGGDVLAETILNAATGNEVAYQFDYTTNKATSGNDTGLLINQTDTASPGTSLLADFQVGGASKFTVSNIGYVTSPSVIEGANIASNVHRYLSINTTVQYQSFINTGNVYGATFTNSSEFSATSGSQGMVAITPTYNQVSGTAANTDLLINRTETAIGSGSQYLVDAQVDGTSQFVLTNTGQVGIGSSSPSARLTIDAGSDSGNLIIATTTSNAAYLTLGSSYGEARFGVDNFSGVLMGAVSGAGMSFTTTGIMYPLQDLTATNDYVELGSSSYRFKTGWFKRLDVLSSYGGIFKMDDLATGNIIMDSPNYDIDLQTNNISRIYIENNGNVGIGSTTPGHLLTVGGNAWVGGNLTATGTGSFTGNVDIGSGLDVTGNITVTGTVDGKDIATNAAMLNEAETISADWDNTANPWADNEISSTLTIGSGGTIDPQAITLVTGNILIGDASNNAIATSSLFVDSDGKIGIGTTSPQGTLTVESGQLTLPVGSAATPSLTFNGDLDTGIYRASADQIGFTSGGTNNFSMSGSRLTTFNAGGGIYNEVSSLTNPTLTPNWVDSDTGLGWSSTNILSLITGGASRILVDDTGLVGIGTTSPASKLDVWGDLRVGTSSTPTLFTDVSTGYVGVGTESPAVELDVVGQITSSSNINVGDDLRLLSANYIRWGGAEALIGTTASGLFEITPHSTWQNVTIDTAGTERFRITNTGNVGIGTSSPSAKLDVVGTLGSQDAIFTVSSTTATDVLSSLFTVLANGNTNVANSLTVGGVVSVDDTTDSASVTTGSIHTDGGLGVAKKSFFGDDMSINGNLSFGPLGSGVEAILSPTTANGTVQITSEAEDLGANLLLNSGSHLGGLPFDVRFRSDGTTELHFDYSENKWDFQANDIVTTGNVGIGSSSPSASLTIQGTGGQTANLFSIASSTGEQFVTVTNDGKVSIGTSTTDSSSNVWIYSGDLGAGLKVESANYNANLYLEGANNQLNIGAYRDAYSAVSEYAGKVVLQSSAWPDFTNDGTLALSAYDTNAEIHFYTGGRDAGDLNMVIDSTGNVGIGTTTPDSKLHVYESSGAIRGVFETPTSNTTSAVDFMTGSANFNIGVGTSNTFRIRDASFSMNPIVIEENSFDNALYIKAGGNVGIGTSSPTQKLTVESGGSTEIMIRSTSSTTWPGFKLEHADQTWNVQVNGSTDQLRFRDVTNSVNPFTIEAAAPNDSLFIESTGNIGIGTSSPAAKLHVAGTVGGNFGAMFSNTASNAYVNNQFKNDAGLSGYVGLGGSSLDAAYNGRIYLDSFGGNGVSLIGDSGDIRFYIDGTTDSEEVMRIDTNGNVGIGSSSPTANLTVQATGGQTANLFAIASSTGTEFVTVTSGGGVGIGTPEPSGAFHVTGNTYFDGASIFKTRYETGATKSPNLFFRKANGDSSTPTQVLSGDRISQINSYGYHSGGAFSQSVAGIRNVAVQDFTASAWGTQMEFGTVASGSTAYATRMTISDDGNVGIGTTSPNSRLSVTAATAGTGASVFNVVDSAFATLFEVDDDGMTTIGDSSGTGDAVFQFAANNNAWSIGYESSDKSFRIASSTSLTSAPWFVLQKSGNLGLGGVTSPDQDLHITGSIIGTPGGVIRLENQNSTIATDDVLGTLEFEGQDSSEGAGGVRAQISAVSEDATGGTKISFYTADTSTTTLVESAYISKTGQIFAESMAAVGSDPLCWDGTGGSLIGDCSSLREYKENITDLDLGLETVLALTPRRFDWIEEFGGENDLGFVAEEVNAVDPILARSDGETGVLQGVKYDKMSALFVKAIQDLNLNLETIASTTDSPTFASQSFAESFFGNLFSRITEWLADASNGIGDFFANRVSTKEICVSDESGETCITKTQLDSLLGASSAAVSEEGTTTDDSSTGDSDGGDSGSTGTTTDTGTGTTTDSGTETGTTTPETGDTSTTTDDTNDDSTGTENPSSTDPEVTTDPDETTTESGDPAPEEVPEEGELPEEIPPEEVTEPEIEPTP